jgi:hypothetical protein
MIWQDLMLDRWVDEADLQVAAAAAFRVPATAVAIADDAEQLATTVPSARVVLERTRQHRDFPLQILVVLRDDELAQRLDGFDGALQVARKLADQLNATVVFAEGPLSPSAWVRVHPHGRVDVVSLDVDESGDIDSFFVVAQHELPADHQPVRSKGKRLTA